MCDALSTQSVLREHQLLGFTWEGPGAWPQSGDHLTGLVKGSQEWAGSVAGLRQRRQKSKRSLPETRVSRRPGHLPSATAGAQQGRAVSTAQQRLSWQPGRARLANVLSSLWCQVRVVP